MWRTKRRFRCFGTQKGPGKNRGIRLLTKVLAHQRRPYSRPPPANGGGDMVDVRSKGSVFGWWVLKLLSTGGGKGWVLASRHFVKWVHDDLHDDLHDYAGLVACDPKQNWCEVLSYYFKSFLTVPPRYLLDEEEFALHPPCRSTVTRLNS